MSAESYYTEIKPDNFFSEDTPRYRMETQSYPDIAGSKTEGELRGLITNEGRRYQPIKWAAWFGSTVGAIYTIAGVTGHPLPSFTSELQYQQTMGIGLYFVSQYTLEIFGNTLSSWKSKKRAFDRTFPDHKIYLIPERFHPTSIIRRIRGK